MSLGKRSLIAAFVLTTLLCVVLALCSLAQYSLIASMIALPSLYGLWHLVDRKARAFWIVFQYEHPVFQRHKIQQSSPYYVPMNAQPKQEYEQPQAQYRY